MSQALPPIQMLWIDGPLSTLERLSMASFAGNGHPVHVYTYGSVPNAPQGVVLMDANAILPSDERLRPLQRGVGAGSWAFFSNLFRYSLLFQKGGIWCDTDMVCIRPFDFPSERKRIFCTERVRANAGEVPSIRANNCFMQVQAGDELMRECLEQAARIDGDASQWGTAGPALLTSMINNHQLAHELIPPAVFCPIDWWGFAALVQGIQLLDAETLGIHFWNEMWRRNYFDKDATYGPLTLYERLKSHYLGKEG